MHVVPGVLSCLCSHQDGEASALGEAGKRVFKGEAGASFGEKAWERTGDVKRAISSVWLSSTREGEAQESSRRGGGGGGSEGAQSSDSLLAPSFMCCRMESRSVSTYSRADLREKVGTERTTMRSCLSQFSAGMNIQLAQPARQAENQMTGA